MFHYFTITDPHKQLNVQIPKNGAGLENQTTVPNLYHIIVI
jgi:hypothetical protein